jgi:hypothetical protein
MFTRVNRRCAHQVRPPLGRTRGFSARLRQWHSRAGHALVATFVRAWESGDLDALVALVSIASVDEAIERP